MTYYLDASAAVKLVKPEPETAALAGFVRRAADEYGPRAFVASDLLHTELIGTVLQSGFTLAEAMRVMSSVVLFRLSPQICEAAGMLVGQLGLRSLDALHLATAVTVRSSLTAVVTYDQRFSDAAERLGLRVESPR